MPLEAVISNLRHRAEQCAVLADELDQEVSDTVERMLEQHAEASEKQFDAFQCIIYCILYHFISFFLHFHNRILYRIM